MAQNTRRNHMVTHLAFIIKNGEKQKTPALNNKERGKAKSTQKKQKHTYLINRQTYISNILPHFWNFTNFKNPTSSFQSGKPY